MVIEGADNLYSKREASWHVHSEGFAFGRAVSAASTWQAERHVYGP